MSIVDKLGISNWHCEQTERVDTGLDVFIFDDDEKGIAWTYNKKCGELIATAPEMLEAIIKWVASGEGIREFKDVVQTEIDFKSVIEKATGKSWEEIKELL